jgi:REP element-mobilizing transposase RayT
VPRKLRQEEPGAIFHVYARGNNKQAIFLDDRDRTEYLRLLAETVRHCGWRLLGYCLMNNHVHLLVETPKPNLGSGIQRLHGKYGIYFNERHGRVGHVFQGRFGAERIKSEGQFWAAAAYVVRNPVEAGLCPRPEDWTWSSHRYVLDGTAPAWLDAARLIWHFSGVGGEPIRVYARAAAGV